jgi:membrane protease YdiL (CAAX protease family)
VTPPRALPPVWGLRAAGAAALWGFLLASCSLPSLLRRAPDGAAGAPDPLFVLGGAAVPLVAGLAIAAWVARPRPLPGLSGVLGLGGPFRSASLLACGFLAGLAVSVPVVGLFSLSQALLEPLGFSPEPQPAVAWLMDSDTPRAALVALALAAVVFAPLAEEILYRALLFGGLAAQGKAVRAAVLSSLFFAALHLSVPAVLPLFALALFFCAVWRRWGLAASFGAHAGFNAANVAFALFLS